MNNTKNNQKGESEESREMPKWGRRCIYIFGVVLYLIAILIVLKMLDVGVLGDLKKPTPDVTNVVIALLGVGSMLLIPWEYLDISEFTFYGASWKRVAKNQEISRSELELRVIQIEGQLAELLLSKSVTASVSPAGKIWAGEHKKDPDEQKNRTEALIHLMQKRQGRFMNISRILRYAKDDQHEPLQNLRQVELREVVIQLVANDYLEVKFSKKSGNQLYRWK